MELLNRAIGRITAPMRYARDQLVYAYRRDVQCNPPARFRFSADMPRLDDVQNSVLSSLERDGYAKVDYLDLFGNGDAAQRSFAELVDAGVQFMNAPETARTIAEYSELQPGDSGRGKAYLCRLSPPAGVPVFSATHPLIRFITSSRVLDIANSYIGMLSKIQTADIWYTIPRPSDRPRSASQNWHRDREDERFVKLFLFLSDIDDDAGPTEYIPETRVGGRYEHLCPRVSGNIPGRLVYPRPSEVERTVAKEDIVRCTGPIGTLYFIDTSNLHRGGFCRDKGRLWAHWICVSPASLQSRPRFKLSPAGGDDAFSAAARFAVDPTGTLNTLRDYS